MPPRIRYLVPCNSESPTQSAPTNLIGMFWFKTFKLSKLSNSRKLAPQLPPHTISTIFGNNLVYCIFYQSFSFKSYAPLAFRYFRDIFDISVQDYLNSIGDKPLMPIGNPGKFLTTFSKTDSILGASGSCFWITHDDEFIIKTVSKTEAKFLQKLLPGYYLNLDQNPHTLLPKFYGRWSLGPRPWKVLKKTFFNLDEN